MAQKITWELLLIIGIVSNFLFQSCGQGEVEYIHIKSYKYDNQAGYSIVIHKWLNNAETVYKLPQSGEIEFKNEFKGGGCFIDEIQQTAFSPDSDCLLINSDSIRIIFDGSKSYWLKPSDNVDVNILKEVNYQYTKQDNREDYLYKFTDKDYQNSN